MQVPFTGLNPDVISEYKDSYQIETISRDDTERPVQISGDFFPLGPDSYPMDNMIYLLHFTLNDADVNFVIRKGADSATSYGLANITGNTTTGIAVTSLNTHVTAIEHYVVGNELTLFLHLQPSAFFTANAERFYFLQGTLNATLETEALMVSGYFYGYVNSILTPKPQLGKTACCDGHDIAGPYEWPDSTPELMWTHWGQTNITFRYMDAEQPHIVFMDLE